MTESAIAIAKATVVGEAGGEVSTSFWQEDRGSADFLSRTGAIAAPYDPRVLAKIFDNSGILRKNVDSYVVNIDGFGHAFEPVINMAAGDVDDHLRDALLAERAWQGRLTAEDVPEPTAAEITARKKLLDREMRLERARLEAFFGACSGDLPFAGPEGLRGRMRQDVEVVGNGYWEVLRDGHGQPAQFVHLQTTTMRLCREDAQFTEVRVPTRVAPLLVEERVARKRFRRYVQSSDDGNGQAVFYREFGDPRTLSAKTGKYYDSPKALAAAETGSRPANEVLHWKIYSLTSVYGVPRWVGTMLAVLGSRSAEEVNYLYFENKSVPPMAIVVSGGRLAQDATTTIKDFIDNDLKGKRNFHKVLVLEGEPSGEGSGAAGRMQIKLVPLTGAQQADALFREYDVRNDEKVGQAFRLPAPLRGATRDLNRATFEAALDFAELQVFGPLREAFDFVMTQQVLPALGVRYHRYRSLAPAVRDPKGLGNILTEFMKAGIITPEEARDLSEAVFHHKLPRIDAAWTQQPLPLTLAGRGLEDNLATPGVDESRRYGGADFSGQGAGAGTANGAQQTGGAAAAVSEGDVAGTVVKALLKIRDACRRQEVEEVRKELTREEERVQVPADVWARLVG